MSSPTGEAGFCPRCHEERPAELVACPRCGLPLTAPEIPRLRQIWLERRALDEEWTDVAAQMWSKLSFPQPPASVTPTDGGQARPTAVAPDWPVPRPRQEWTPKRVQNLLLSLGAALCVIAALSFAAVAWGRVGVGGRAAIMLLITAASAVSAHVAIRRGLSATAEALSAITYALLLIDVASAYSYDLGGVRAIEWWGYWAAALVVIGTIGVVQQTASRVAVPGYAGLLLLQFPLPFMLFGLDAGVWEWEVGAGFQIVALTALWGGLAGHGRFRGLRLLLLGLGTTFLVIQTWIAATASVSDLSTDDRYIPLVAVAMTVMGSVYAAGAPMTRFRRPAITAAVAALTVDASAYVVDTQAGSDRTLSIVVLGALLTAAAIAFRKANVPGLLVVAITTTSVGLLLALPVVLGVAGESLTWVNSVWALHDLDQWSAVMGDSRWSGEATTVLALNVAALTFLALAVSSERSDPWRRGGFLAAVALAFAAVDLAILVAGVPFVLSLTIVTVLATAVLVVTHFLGRESTTRVTLFAVGGLLALQALLWSAATEASTIAVLGWALALAAGVGFFDRRTVLVTAAVGSYFLLTLAAAVMQALDATTEETGLAMVAAAAMVAVATAAIRTPALILGLLVAVTGGGLGLILASSDPSLLSVALAVCAAAAAIAAVIARMPSVGWISAGFSVFLLWVRLAVAEVEAVEAYTIPLAFLALSAGYLARRRSDTSSALAYGGGLALTFGPSLTQLSTDSDWVRPLALVVSGLLSVLIGARLRLQAPLVAGTIVLLVTAWVQGQDYFELIPRWALIGTAGIALVSVGATWEARRRDLQVMKARFDDLR